MIIGRDEKDIAVSIPELGLYQNTIVTGSIGSGKTSGFIYPILKQLLVIPNISGLILDVKANMENTIKSMSNTANIICITVNGKHKYNPLDKPNLKPYVIAQRLVDILKLFSNEKATDTYWYDKVQQLFTEAIKLIRIYNNEYVTFVELHKLITSKEYLSEKLNEVSQTFLSGNVPSNSLYNFNSLLDYFKNEFNNLDSKILNTIISEATRITTPFVSDLDISNTFSPKKSELTFSGFKDISNTIVLLQINIADFPALCKILAAYLKLDYQSSILSNNNSNVSFFLCDEYQEYVTQNDANFFSLSREYKVINIISTQSYSSILNTIKDEHLLNVFLQSFVNKILLRTDDVYTIEYMQKLFGKEDKIKNSIAYSENAQETKYSPILNSMHSKKSNISESYSSYVQVDSIFDSKDFSLKLNTFEAIAYISNGEKMKLFNKIYLLPYFRKE